MAIDQTLNNNSTKSDPHSSFLSPKTLLRSTERNTSALLQCAYSILKLEGAANQDGEYQRQEAEQPGVSANQVTNGKPLLKFSNELDEVRMEHVWAHCQCSCKG